MNKNQFEPIIHYEPLAGMWEPELPDLNGEPIMN